MPARTSINGAELRRRLRKQIDAHEPAVAAGFRHSVQDLRSNVIMKDLVDALKRKDIEGAIIALNIQPAAFAPLRKAYSDAFDTGGQTVADMMPPLEKRNGS